MSGGKMKSREAYKKCCVVALLLIIVGAGGYRSALAQFEFPKQDKASFFEMFGDERRISVSPNPRYNRVEGLFLGANVTTRPLDSNRMQFFIDGGYGFTSKKWRYEFGLQYEFFQFDRLTLGVSYYNTTLTNDSWKITSSENTLAALFLKEDFYDYFGRQGWAFRVNQMLWGRHTARLVYSSYEYEDMGQSSGFARSIFGKDKAFRPNPHIAEGTEQSLKLMLEFDWLDSPLLPMEGWLVQAIYERTFEDFETDGLFLKVYRYQPTFMNQRILARAFFGARAGSMAAQHMMDIGGVGTLRAFRDKCQGGQNLYMVNVNYLFGGDILQRIPLQFIPFYDQLSMGLFFDAGSAWSNLEVKESLFENLDATETLFNAGLSLLIADGLCRFDFARQLEGGESDWRITMRLLSSF